MMSTHAVKLAALSIPVFPCQLNKKRYTARGFKDASSARNAKMTIGEGQP